MTNHLSEVVDDLASSIDELEDVLAPLLSNSLPELNKQLSSPLDRAKLQVWLSYVLNDLVWIQLRTKGFNPNNLGAGETHDVVGELDRVKSYFAKIKEAENPAKRTLAVDGKVANRFIKHALASISQENFAKPTHTRFDESGNATSEPPAAGPSKAEPKREESDKSSSSSSDEEPAPGTWKAKKRAREAALAASKADQDASEDEDEPMVGWEEPQAASKIEPTDDKDSSTDLVDKRKRPRMDPFAGYEGSPTKPGKPKSTSASQPEPESKTDLLATEDSSTSRSPSPSVESSASTSTSQKKTRRTRRGGRRVDQRRENKRDNLAREAVTRAAAKK
ncbi:unnamed protein product [Rhizoctonia solani]|uniref:Exosome complex protein n=1 Tax=Rhizoctonia solani TaxID=456999 RepID=A0A8H3EEA9_9AGAM|nr:unnamed protein product [Rhizoctonia solani]